MACVRAAFCPTGIIVRASGHQALYGVEYGELFLSLSAIQKANPFRDASTNDTRTALQRMVTALMLSSVTTRTSGAESLYTCPSWPFRWLARIYLRTISQESP